MQRARVTRVSCIALGLPRTTLTRVALVVVVILVVTLQMHYKHTHRQREGERVGEMEARSRTQRHVLAIFANFCCVAKVATWAENAGNARSERRRSGVGCVAWL